MPGPNQLDSATFKAWIKKPATRQPWLYVSQINDPTDGLREAGVTVTRAEMWSAFEALKDGFRVGPCRQ